MPDSEAYVIFVSRFLVHLAITGTIANFSNFVVHLAHDVSFPPLEIDK